MVRHACVILSLAAMTAGAMMLSGCEADESLPTRPRASSPLTPDKNSQDNAEHRALEAPKREMPTGGAEFPGQSRAEPVDSGKVVTLQGSGGEVAVPANTTSSGSNSGSNSWSLAGIQGFSGPTGRDAFGHTTGPSTEYTRDMYPGPLPTLPANPGTVPMTGSVVIPGGDWSVDNSWGQGLVLENYPHRAWPTSTAYYQSGAIKNNPIYYFHLQEHINAPQGHATMGDDWVSNLYEIPWFYLNTAALPVLMVLEPPLAQRTTAEGGMDPNFLGHLPTGGAVVPSPPPGTIRWEYPFMNPDGSIKETGRNNGPTTMPSLVPTP